MKDYIPLEQINKQLLTLTSDKAKTLKKRLKEESRARGMIYVDDDERVRVIDVMLRPWIITKQQVRFFHPIIFAVKEALKVLMPLYFSNACVREIIPLTEDEERWVRDVKPEGCYLKYQRLFGRIDSNATFDEEGWREGFSLLEPNTVGVGGVHYLPCAKGIVKDVVLPSISWRHTNNGMKDIDVRDILIYELNAQAQATGRKRCNVALLENQDYITGTDEFSRLCEYLNRYGLKTFVCDPRELYLYKDEVYLNSNPIDIIYRDCELVEFIEIEKKAGRLKAMRQAFRNNQVISGVAGEFDHKSAWEIFTDERFYKFFSRFQRSIFKKYCLWTRLIRPVNTNDPEGKRVDLIRYIKNNKDNLVLKPNRLYGGAGVIVGKTAKDSEWQKALDKAARRPYSFVVQRVADVHKEDFPVVSREGRVSLEKYFVVSGFFVTHNALACVGRSCRDSVVNVSRGGGLIAVFNT